MDAGNSALPQERQFLTLAIKASKASLAKGLAGMFGSR
jgi:hypothetical protein